MSKFIRKQLGKLSPSRALSFVRRPADKVPQLLTSLKDFSNANFERLDPKIPIEEETLPGYDQMWPYYYPVRIGEVFACRYQVVGKLGFGMTATTWLARDLKHSRYVVLKIYLESRFLGYREPPEIAAYECLNAGPKDHPGRKAIRRLLGWFTIMGPTGKHYCLVHPPLWGSLSDWLETQKSCICTGCTNFPRVTAHMLAVILRQIFLALDYAKECDIVHTDISANNVMFEIQDNSVLEEIERAELEDPMPRKEIHGRFIYQSYLIPLPKNAAGPGLPLLCDFGEARCTQKELRKKKEFLGDDIFQPDIYRAPEVCLGMRWGFEVDIWNVGCMGVLYALDTRFTPTLKVPIIFPWKKCFREI
ncbi:Dual specificity tyrosine-phosphorylation-regulated kinase mbk-2 [Termitomyces sp. T112]|nr:Dual specificity tyrosine-phosphorylation-regulated kinase mbk-2 [Termitomyces sp. T112]